MIMLYPPKITMTNTLHNLTNPIQTVTAYRIILHMEAYSKINTMMIMITNPFYNLTIRMDRILQRQGPAYSLLDMMDPR